MAKYRFSVFTATYNRGPLLRRVYACLLRQTFRDFEWVIVDDGSEDDTEAICREFMAEGRIPIKYRKKPNGGKHTAWRVATDLFDGEYEIGADDDDLFPDDTLEIFDRNWRILEQSSEYDRFWEIRGRCADENGDLVGEALPAPVFDSDYNEINYKYRCGFCEMQGCRKVSVLRNEAAVPEHFLFEDKVSNFSEGIRWSRAARHYKTRFIGDIVRSYYRTEGALTSRNKGGERSMRRTYNSLVGNLYALNEQHDLILKYSRKMYIKRLAAIAYWGCCLKEDAVCYLEYRMDRLLVRLFYFPMRLIYWVRR